MGHFKVKNRFNISSELIWEYGVLLLLGFLFGRTMIIGGLWPFGLPYLAAVRTSLSRGLVLSYFAVLLGVISRDPLRFGFAALGLFVFLVLMQHVFSRIGSARLRLGVAVFLTSFLGDVLAEWMAGHTWQAFVVLALLRAVIVTFTAFLLAEGLPEVTGDGRVLEKKLFGRELAAILTITLAMMGTTGLGFAGLRGNIVLGGVVVLVAARLGGMGGGAAAGAMLGALSYVSVGSSIQEVAFVAVGGALAGAFRSLGRFGIAASFLLGDFLLAALRHHLGGMLRTVEEESLAAFLFLLLPTRFFLWVQRTRGLVAAPPPQSTVLSSRETVAKPMLVQAISQLSHTFNEMAAVSDETDERRLARLLGTVSDNVCRGCNFHAVCWNGEFYKTYRTFVDVLALAELGKPLSVSDLAPELIERCPRQGELMVALGYVHLLHRHDAVWHHRLEETQRLISSQLKGIATVLEEPRPRPTQLNYWLRTGIATAAKHGGEVNGDSHLVKEYPDGRLVLAIADGMGAGPQAAMESQAAIAMMEQLLGIGFDQRLAVQTVNAALLVRSDEMYSTMDLAIVDQASGHLEMMKIAATPTYIKRKEGLSVITAASVPMGILRDVEAQMFEDSLRPGDFLIMTSDGIMMGERGDATDRDWLQGYLHAADGVDPQRLAEALLERAMMETGGEVYDDLTVLVARLELRGQAERAEERIRDWLRPSSHRSSV